ncbi:histidine kinase [Staphylococcus chromogenes]|nr:histidine kinase [Staphylococcus chromogenes]
MKKLVNARWRGRWTFTYVDLAVSWKVATIGGFLLVMNLALSPHKWALAPVVAIAIAILLASLAPRWPLLMGIFYTGLFLMVSAHEGWRSPLIVLWTGLFVAMIAYSGRWGVAIVFAVVLLYVSTTNVFAGTFLPIDGAGTVIMTLLLGAGVWAGTLMRNSSIRHAAEKQRMAEEIENHREALVRMLHDSVATTLTSVVMRAETLGLIAEEDKETRNAAELIADETRQAMQEVRHLIQVMKTGEELENLPISRSIPEQLAITQRLLVSHGYRVKLHIQDPLQAMSFPPEMAQVFAELSTNAVKYATPHSDVSIEVSRSEDGCVCELINRIGQPRRDMVYTSGIGLNRVRELLEKSGSVFEYTITGNYWHATIRIPEQALRH